MRPTSQAAIAGFVAFDLFDLVGFADAAMNFASQTLPLTAELGATAALTLAGGVSEASRTLHPDGHGVLLIAHS